MNPDCNDIRSKLLDLVEGTLSSTAEAAARRHLAGCDACRVEFEGIEQVAGALPDAAPLRPPPEVRRRLLSLARDLLRSPGRAQPGRRIGGRRGQWIAVAGIVTGLAAALTAAVLLSPETRLIVPGDAVPEFHAIDVQSGTEISLADFAGEVVLLNIWATWCAPCEQEMPSMERLHQELGPKGLRIVAVSVDQESTHKVQRWAEERGLTFTILHDRSGQIEQAFQTTGVPESFVIDRHGRLLKREIGPREWDGPRQTELFERLLANGSGG